MKRILFVLLIGAAVLACSTAFAAVTWTTQSLHVPQSSYGIVVPGERPSNVGGNFAILTDRVQLFDDGAGWWLGTLSQPSTAINIQIVDGDANDGEVQIYVDRSPSGTPDFVYCTQNAGNVLIRATGLSNAAHFVYVQPTPQGSTPTTCALTGDVSLDYVAAGTGSSVPSLTTWGLIVLGFLLLTAGAIVVARRRPEAPLAA